MGLLDRFKKEAEKKAGKKTAVRTSSASTKTAAETTEVVSARSTVVAMPADIAHVLKFPLVTEKTARLGALNQYVFSVHPQATKLQIKAAVRAKYGTTPTSVSVIRQRGKSVAFGRVRGMRQQWKKAIVSMPKGKTLAIHEGV